MYKKTKLSYLDDEGKKYYKHLLGLKMYLKHPEKHNGNVLTPETFEKYLPFAIVFGVEKNWIKVFEKLNSEPTVKKIGWHNNISVTAFSSSFTAALNSAINKSRR